MDSTFQQKWLNLKIPVDHWLTTSRFIREAIPTELRQAITASLSSHQVRLIKIALNLGPYSFRITSTKSQG